MEFASLESVPNELIDNAAVLGTLSLITAALFLLDLGGPRAKKPQPHALIVPQSLSKQYEIRHPNDAYNLENDLEKRMVGELRNGQERHKEKEVNNKNNSDKTSNGHANGNGFAPGNNHGQNGYSKMKDKTKRFDIYGKDVDEDDKAESELDFDDASSKTELHSPVWSKIRKGASKYFVYLLIN